MPEPHVFVSDQTPGNRCAADDGDGTACRRAEGADVHRVDATVARVRRATDSGPRPIATGHNRRSVPWSKLPLPSKVILGTVTLLGLALAVCVVATACRLILSAGGWFG